MVKVSEKHRHLKYPLNTDAFNKPLSVEAAYWLGLLYADGSMTLGSTGYMIVSLTSHIDDIALLEGFLKFLGRPMNPIYRRRDKRAASTLIGSKKLCAQLCSLGVVPRKTKTIRFPKWLPKTRVAPFVRGYFDGDGSIWTYLPKRYKTPQIFVKFTGNPQFMKELQCVVSGNLEIPLTKVSLKKDRIAVASIHYGGRQNLERLRKWLYSDGGPYLARKRRLFP